MSEEESLKKLEEWLKKASEYSFPAFKELPDIPLNMDQVIYYINKVYGPINTEGSESPLTPFMVHNYVKAKIIDEPVKKKYNEVHLGYLIAICMLKKTLSMNEISLLIDMDKDVSTDVSTLYRFFATMSSNMISSESEKLEERVEKYSKYREKIKDEDPENAEKLFRDFIGLLALRLALQSSVNQMLSKGLIQYLDETSEQPVDKALAKSEESTQKAKKKSEKKAVKAVKKTKRIKE